MLQTVAALKQHRDSVVNLRGFMATQQTPDLHPIETHWSLSTIILVDRPTSTDTICLDVFNIFYDSVAYTNNIYISPR